MTIKLVPLEDQKNLNDVLLALKKQRFSHTLVSTVTSKDGENSISLRIQKEEGAGDDRGIESRDYFRVLDDLGVTNDKEYVGYENHKDYPSVPTAEIDTWTVPKARGNTTFTVHLHYSDVATQRSINLLKG